jgi:hypothetical protein
MSPLDDLQARYQAGETLSFGSDLRLAEGTLWYGAEAIALCHVVSAAWEQDHLVITGYGNVQLLAVPAETIEGVGSLELLINRLVARVPYLERRAPSGWPPGSIGDISSQIGYDVRELYITGYSDAQIRRVRSGEITLDDLLRVKPEGRRQCLSRHPHRRRR